MQFDWDPEKNAEVIEKHGISFEEVVDLISRRRIIKTISNPNPKYKAQKIMLVRREKAVYLIPFEIRQDKIWLITAFFSDYFSKKYSR
jgi:uncharacterized DUF497 family protein